MTMTKKLFTYLLSTLLLLALAVPSFAQWPDDRRDEYRKDSAPRGPGMGRGMEPGGRAPFGAYCPKGHVGQYGARQPVLNIDDARDRLRLYFNIDASRIRRLEERRHVFLAEITSHEGRPMELVIIDRRTGRIRSIR